MILRIRRSAGSLPSQGRRREEKQRLENRQRQKEGHRQKQHQNSIPSDKIIKRKTHNLVLFLLLNLNFMLGNFCLAQEQTTPISVGPILNIHFRCPDPGGIESHLLALHKACVDHGINDIVMTSKYSDFLIKELSKAPSNNVEYVTFDHEGWLPNENDILSACKKHNIAIVICNSIRYLHDIINARSKYPIKIIYVHHNFTTFSPDEIASLNQIDGVIAVSPPVLESLKDLKKSGQLTVKNLAHIIPFWQEKTFASFKSTRTKQQFFEQEFGITLTDSAPIICSVANMYWYKNHQVLLQALGMLHKINHTKFHLMLAGTGPEEAYLKTIVHSLELEPYVHFLGKTLLAPELLYHSDIHVLPSSNESFGLVHLEAAVTKKPFIGATKTGAEGFIQDGITGFIFENNDKQDLADKLKALLENKSLLNNMGQKAYDFVQQHYTTKQLFNQWLEFLKHI